MTMKKVLALILVFVIVAFCFTGCASMKRLAVDIKSDFKNGLNRVINIYTADGNLLATYSGKIDLEANAGGYIKFDINGKRYVYYNCFVETIADIK